MNFQTMTPGDIRTVDVQGMIVSDFFSHLIPQSELTVSQWANTYRYLPPESSAEPGKWKTARTPYLEGIMDAANDPGVHTIVAMTASQVGKSEALNNILFYFMHQDPCSILMIQPTLTDAEDYSKSRIMASVRATPALDGIFGEDSKKSRSSSNTILSKYFPGGRFVMVGANSPSGLSSRPIRVILADEIGRYETTKEGDAIELARQRQATYWNRLLVLTSTPGVKGICPIERWYSLSDQRKYFVPCPGCDTYQVLKWSQVQWEHDENGNHDYKSAAYVCEHCGELLSDADINAMVQRGEWRATAPFSGIAGFGCLNALYSPWTKMADVAKSFIDAKDDVDLLRVWVNTKLGEAWEDAHERVDAVEIYERREPFDLVVPIEAGVLTAAIDVQDDRLELLVKAWGRNEESWDMEHVVFLGDPGIIADIKGGPGQMQFDEMTEPGGVWGKVWMYLQKEFDHESGIRLPIAGVAVDTGGHKTDQAYEFVRQCRRPRAYAIKGSNQRNVQLVGSPSKKNKAKLPVYMLGTHVAKDVILNRLQRRRSGPGSIHIPDRMDIEYCEQLVSEKKVRRKIGGRMVEDYVPTRKRNEALDLQVYNLALLRILYPNRSVLNSVIDRVLEKKKEPPAPPSPEVQKLMKTRVKQKSRRGGFVTRWKD